MLVILLWGAAGISTFGCGDGTTSNCYSARANTTTAARAKGGGVLSLRLAPEMREQTVMGKHVVRQKVRAYVWVNNRAEGNAPLTVQALVDMMIQAV